MNKNSFARGFMFALVFSAAGFWLPVGILAAVILSR